MGSEGMRASLELDRIRDHLARNETAIVLK
jgi:hypothetical protein